MNLPLSFSQATRHWLYDYANQGIILTDSNMVIQGWNQWMEIHTGRPASAVLRRNLYDCFPEIRERKLDRWYQKAIEGQVVILSQLFHRFLIAMPPTVESPAFEHMQQMTRVAPLIADNQVIGTLTLVEDVSERVAREYELKERNRLLSESEARMRQALDAARQAEQAIEQLNASLERKVQERSAELAHSQEELAQSQKMEAIGLLAGGVAHDFNNLITGIMGMTEDVRSSLEPGDTRFEELTEVVRASQRAFDLTRQLLTFARRQAVRPTAIQLNAVVADMNKMLMRLIGEDIELRTQFDSNLPIMRADQGQIQQILTNLVLNSRDAMPRGGVISVRTSAAKLADENAFGLPSGDYVLLEVTDNGAGMDDTVLGHIFEPFFTTKDRHKGTGLGLSTVYGIVKQSHGEIQVLSQPGQGTTFRLAFPAIKTEIAVEPELPMSVNPLQGNEVILVVEDESIVSRVVVKKLRQFGYQVLEARDGKEAMALGWDLDHKIDLVISDVVMPGMNGKELIERLRTRRPNLKVLYMSGYTDDIIANKGILDSGINFIEKASLVRDLPQKVRDILDARPAAPNYPALHN